MLLAKGLAARPWPRFRCPAGFAGWSLRNPCVYGASHPPSLSRVLLLRRLRMPLPHASAVALRCQARRRGHRAPTHRAQPPAARHGETLRTKCWARNAAHAARYNSRSQAHCKSGRHCNPCNRCAASRILSAARAATYSGCAMRTPKHGNRAQLAARPRHNLLPRSVMPAGAGPPSTLYTRVLPRLAGTPARSSIAAATESDASRARSGEVLMYT